MENTVRVLLLVCLLSLIAADGAANAQSGSSPTASTPSEKMIQEKSAKYYSDCMKSWDAGTHMTKGEWSRTCRRVNDERVKFRVDNKMRLP
jgi:hypothetical protein